MRRLDKPVKYGELPFVEDPDDLIIESQNFMPSLAFFGFDRSDVPAKEDWDKACFNFIGGEDQAWKRLKEYMFESKSLGDYRETRDGISGPSYSSKLSPYLANGCISAKSAL